MSFREKSAWIVAVSMLGVYGFYFWTLAQAAAAGQTESFHYGSLLAKTVFVLVIVQIVLHVAVAIPRPVEAKAPRDERDALIALKAIRCAFIALSAGVVVVCFSAALYPSSFFIVNGLLFVLVMSETVRVASQIVYYRLSA
jgi:uncharacterized membrane protein